jgi:hypothetical protein
VSPFSAFSPGVSWLGENNVAGRVLLFGEVRHVAALIHLAGNSTSNEGIAKIDLSCADLFNVF